MTRFDVALLVFLFVTLWVFVQHAFSPPPAMNSPSENECPKAATVHDGKIMGKTYGGGAGGPLYTPTNDGKAQTFIELPPRVAEDD